MAKRLGSFSVHFLQKIPILALGVLCTGMLYAQDTLTRGALPPPQVLGPNDTITVYLTRRDDGSWVPTSALPDVQINGKWPKHLRKKQREWTRLRNAVYVTYPYAQSASVVLREIQVSLATATSDKHRKAIIKAKEKELKDAFGDKITNLSIYQGKVLMKLINRQTGFNCYEILKEYKGGANARFWQTVAFFFGGNLKQPYNAQGEDAEMEGIVLEVERMYWPYGG